MSSLHPIETRVRVVEVKTLGLSKIGRLCNLQSPVQVSLLNNFSMQ